VPPKKPTEEPECSCGNCEVCGVDFEQFPDELKKLMTINDIVYIKGNDVLDI
jgi:hypothetical protein